MTESIITTKKPKNKIVNNDFGLFEVYFYNSDGISDSAVLTADGVVNWDNKKYGKADFESQGQHYGVYSIFQLNFVSGSEIQKLDELISPTWRQTGKLFENRMVPETGIQLSTARHKSNQK